MHHGRTTVLWLLSLSVNLCGISCSRQQPFNSVQGKVVLKDQPLGGAKVIFHPASDGAALTDWPAAITTSDGTFTLKTGGRTGAPEGNYKVSIVCMEPSKSKPDGMAMGPTEEVDRLKGVYSDPATSKFSIEIKSGTNQLEPFVLQ